MSVLAPVWTQQLSADGFAEFADGHLSTDTSFELTIEAGGQTLRGIVTVAASSGTGGIAALRDRPAGGAGGDRVRRHLDAV
jgi:hypothetical protein